MSLLCKHLTLGLLFLLSTQVFAKKDSKELPPLDPKFMGVHPMVLVNNGPDILASYLPSYQVPKNHQLVYKLKVKNVALVQLVRDGGLITIEPKPFNLQRLMRGESMTVTADVYMGHFQRDGMLTYKSMALDFDRKLYWRTLTELAPSGKTREYDAVDLGKNHKLLIHKIQKAPSFDHLLIIDEVASCLLKFNTSSAIPKESELHYKFFHCGTIKPLYYETEGFSY
ncbi:hypothetical protein SG34_007665 [Thalassomonas viridans]|uniref:Uncharacterized protein n=1 Tax=Thalassomonas viridans TaxID=137584 RepID=A0AAE9Z673_9GAMM|nr:hypothetical protein [Thalassomonas viridans]WDE06770.1 hypothetical protein SG34_007665 [Thalassomonas viridans]